MSAPAGANFRGIQGTLCVVVAIVALLAAALFRVDSVVGPAIESPPLGGALAPLKPQAEAAKPDAPPRGYVGSAVCAKCHGTIAQVYAAHPMHRSAGRTPGGNDIESFADANEFRLADGRAYRVVKEGNAIYHHEALLDNDGQVIYDQAAKISLFFGSGARGKSYAIDRDGLLFQSPISWYTRDRKWDLSPGYLYSQVGFGRRISEGCVHCHAGQSTHDPSREDYFPEPVMVEAAIGCERCHGPGEKHVEFHRSPTGRQAGDPIVNPATLAPDRREAVCYQCHLIGEARLPRYGRTFGDFRPGDRLDDVWATLVDAASVRGDGKTKAVSHVEQMRQSACFRRSDGHLGCGSCHDPHSVPSGDTAAYYRQQCLTCHAERRCSLPAEEQSAPPASNSCVHCHMPRLQAHDVAHTSQTDHRIGRDPAGLIDAPPRATSGDLVLFDEEHATMPEWEIRRAKGLAAVLRLEQSRHVSAAVADELVQTFSQIASIAPDDPRTWAALGAVYELRQDHANARSHWQRVLALRSDDETALDALAAICRKTRDYQAGLSFSDRLLALNPYRPRARLRRAMLLAQLDRWDEAIVDAETAVQMEPADKSSRQWLIDAYQRVGDAAAAGHHADILRRLSTITRPRG